LDLFCLKLTPDLAAFDHSFSLLLLDFWGCDEIFVSIGSMNFYPILRIILFFLYMNPIYVENELIFQTPDHFTHYPFK